MSIHSANAQDRFLRRTFSLSLIAAFLFATAHRLPAPIQEIQESPTPASEEQTKPKRTRAKSRNTDENSATSISPAAKQSTPEPTKFAGTWTGTVNVPNPLIGGNTQCTYIVNSVENAVKENCERFTPNTSPATISGNTITWKNGLFNEYTNSLTVANGGRTGQIAITSAWGKGSGTVTRTGPAEDFPIPGGAQTKRGPEIPTAKPVPDKPGFVYNPFDSNTTVLLDVRGKPSGTKLKDPFSGKLFIVP
jgi:hypothetical protein